MFFTEIASKAGLKGEKDPAKLSRQLISSSHSISSRTCPTCRNLQTPASLIKLYFDFDDNKANLDIDEILKTNDELSKEMKKVQEKSNSSQDQLREMEKKLKDATEKSKFLERQKQLDDMAIAGLKSIKEDSTKEIIKLNGWMKLLKLDLLAEKQVRRLQQQTLHDLDPENENYNIAHITVDDSKATELQNDQNDSILVDLMEQPAIIRPITPFWKLNCEAKQVETEPPKLKTCYILPSKIQKNTIKEPQPHQKVLEKATGFRLRSPQSLVKNVAKPQGFQFSVPSTSSALNFQASTSTASPAATKTQKRMFGEEKPLFDASPASSLVSSSAGSNNIFNFSMNGPTFQPSSSSPSLPITSNFTNIMRNYRERTEPSSPFNPSVNFSIGSGPKISDR